MVLILGMVVLILGLIGYTTIPKERFNENMHLPVILNFYMVICFAIFFHMFSLFYVTNNMFVDSFFGISMILASIYLLWNVSNSVGLDRRIQLKFNYVNFKNAVLYSSVIWLMSKELIFIDFQTYTIPGLILLPVFFVLLYPMLVMKEMKVTFFYEEFSSVFSASFLVILFTGIALIGMVQTSQAYVIIEATAATLALYVILKMSKAAEPFMG